MRKISRNSLEKELDTPMSDKLRARARAYKRWKSKGLNVKPDSYLDSRADALHKAGAISGKRNREYRR